MAVGNIPGHPKNIMMENGKMVPYLERVFITLPMETVMKGIGKMRKNMGRELKLLNTIFNKENLEMIISYRVLLGISMETVMMVIGRMGNFMDKDLFMIQLAIVISMEISLKEIGNKDTG
jgi:uncharacterized membrane protein